MLIFVQRWTIVSRIDSRYSLKVKVAYSSSSELRIKAIYGASRAIWDHTVLPATRHTRTRPALTPTSKLVLDLPTTEGWKAELTLATRQCTGRESNLRSLDHKSSALTTTPPNNLGGVVYYNTCSIAWW